MKRIDYTYQDRAARQTLKNALNPNYIAAVLAACPSAGKTTISHKIINDYIKLYPNARIVVLTEGQNTLKLQYLEELENPNVNINFTFGGFQSNAQVRVGIPQSIHQLNWDEIDLIIVDECHNWYLADTVQSIVKKFKPNHKILLTGSPTKYNAHNTKYISQYGIYYIAASDLMKYGVFSAADMDVAKVENTKNPIKTIQQVLSHATKSGTLLSKVMIACPSIAYAKQVAGYLSYIGRKVSLSTSENDKDDLEIKKFKSGQTDVLVVVGKGILGFNDKFITALFDLRCSQNIDASYQLFARILRIHPENVTKDYIRVAENHHYNREVLMLHKIHALMKKEVFMGFTGNNLKFEMVA